MHKKFICKALQAWIGFELNLKQFWLKIHIKKHIFYLLCKSVYVLLRDIS